MPLDLSGGSIPALYRDLYEMINLHGIDKLTSTIFIALFESNLLTKQILNQVWNAAIKTNAVLSRTDFYKCLALMALAQQGKIIDEKLLENYVNRELPIPTMDSITELEDRLIRLLRLHQQKNTLCFRYGDLCSLDTIQVELAPEMKGFIKRHFEYEVTSMRLKNKVSRRYNDFIALHELLTMKYPYRILPQLPPKKAVNVDKEFIEERRRALKRYLQILCRHPTIYDTEIIKFFLTFQGTTCGDNMKATFKNFPDEFSSQLSANADDNADRNEDSDGLQMFNISQVHVHFIHQQLTQIRACLKNINERNMKNAEEFARMEKPLQTLSVDSTRVERWATGPNDYWPTIQTGLADLPLEISAVSERISEQCKREDEVINDHLDMLIELLQGYKDLCKRFEEALQLEQKAIQKANVQQRRTTEPATKDISLETIEQRNIHALKCVQMETQLIYANLEAFVYILSGLGNSQSRASSDLLTVWKSFSGKVSQLGQTYINKSSITRTNTVGFRSN